MIIGCWGGRGADGASWGQPGASVASGPPQLPGSRKGGTQADYAGGHLGPRPWGSLGGVEEGGEAHFVLIQEAVHRARGLGVAGPGGRCHNPPRIPSPPLND